MGVEQIQEISEFYYTVLWSLGGHLCFRGPLILRLSSPLVPHILYFLLQFGWSMASINAFTNPCFWLGYAAITNYYPTSKPSNKQLSLAKVPQDRLVRFFLVNIAGHLCGNIIMIVLMQIVARSPLGLEYISINKPDVPADTTSYASIFIGELVQTFIMIFSSFSLSYLSGLPQISTALIGAAIGSMIVLFGVSWTGCYVNPAAVLAHSFVSIGLNWSLHDIQVIWMIYIAGPVVGSILAGMFVSYLLNFPVSISNRGKGSDKDL